jgi:MFS family permease
MTVGPVAGSLSDRFPPRWFVVTGMLMVSAGLLWISTVSTADTPWSLLPRFLLMGLGAGLALSPMTNAVMSTVPSDYAGSASGMLSTSQRLGAVLGVAVLGAVLQVTLASALTAGLMRVPGMDASTAGRVVAIDQTTASGLVGGVMSLEHSAALAGLTAAQSAALRPVAAGIASSALVDAMAFAFRVGAAVVLASAGIAMFVRPRPGSG